MRIVSRVLTALVASTSLVGCSIVLTKRPNPPPAAPGCSPSYGPPVIDSVVAVTAAIGAPIAGISSEFADTMEERDERALTAGLLGLTALGFFASAFIGGMRVKRCERAIQEHRAAQQRPQQPYPYAPYPPQPYPPQPYPPQPYPPQPYPAPPPQP